MITLVLMPCIFAATALALWFTLKAIVRMNRKTYFCIRASFVLKATGLFVILLAVIDYIFGAPYTWPWLLLTGVSLTNGGIGLFYLTNRRRCACPDCPVGRCGSGGTMDYALTPFKKSTTS